MPESVQKPKKLWGNPKVLWSDEALFVEKSYYPLTNTLGAYVDTAPEGVTVVRTSPFDTVVIVISVIFMIIVAIFSAFLGGQNNNQNSSTTGQTHQNRYGPGYRTRTETELVPLYRLILVSEEKSIAAIRNINKEKLETIASQVNEALVLRGVTPITSERQV